MVKLQKIWIFNEKINFFNKKWIGLTIEEKNELAQLRNEIKKYRDLDAENTNDDSKSNKSHESVS